MKSIITSLLLLISITGNSQSLTYKEDDAQTNGIIMLIGGIGFTTAAAIEGPYNYTTNTSIGNSGNFKIHRPTTQPAYLQFPRNIMFTVGISFTIAGLATLINNK